MRPNAQPEAGEAPGTPFVTPPPALPGSRVGVVTPSSPADPGRLDAGVAFLESLGFEVELGEHVLAGQGRIHPDDRQRVADLNGMWARDDIRAIFASRGGAGASRIIDRVDFDLVRRHPKWFVGYSDVTAIHLALHRFAGLATLYGPMVASDMAGGLNDASRDSLLHGLSVGEGPRSLNADACLPRPTTAVPGEAEGPLVGGTLCVINCSIGTPYEIDTRGKVLFIEDFEEPLWRIERMLVHMLHAAKLAEARGLVFGAMRGVDADEGQEFDQGLREILADLVAPLGKPTICDFPTGHVPNPLTLPLGCMVRLDAEAGVLEVR